MKAMVLHRHGDSKDAFRLDEVDKPEIAEDEVLIKVHSMGLNFADVIARRGRYPDAPSNPAILGYDVAGYVAEVGALIEELKVGDRVTAMTRFGGYAEYAKTKRAGVAKISDQISFEEATALSTQACTAYYCAEECVRMYKGDTVLVQAAAGGVGTILVQLAKNRGCFVYGTASSKKQDYLKDLGVDFCIDYTKEDFAAVIKSQSTRNQVDVVFDSLGGKTYKKAVGLLAKGGKIVNIGAAEQMGSTHKLLGILQALKVVYGFGRYSPLKLLMRSNSLIGVNMLRIADNKPQVFNEVLSSVIKLNEEGIINPTVGKIFPVDEFGAAHDWLEQRKSVGKVVVNW